MSFLGRRLAATEGSFFKKEQDLATANLSKKLAEKGPSTSQNGPQPDTGAEKTADVLPEILSHSLPFSAPQEVEVVRRNLVVNPKDVFGSMEAASLATERANVLSIPMVPQTRLGAGKWDIGAPAEGVVGEGAVGVVRAAATANEMRVQPVDPAKIEMVAKGLARLGGAFIVATAIVFGGASLGVGYACQRWDIKSIDDVRVKGRQAMEPFAARMQQRLEPIRTRVQDCARSCEMDEERRQAISAPVLRSLGLVPVASGAGESPARVGGGPQGGYAEEGVGRQSAST